MEIIDFLKKYGAVLIGFISFFRLGFGLILSDNLDKVFMRKEKQVITSIIKGSFLAIILEVFYFIITFQSPLPCCVIDSWLYILTILFVPMLFVLLIYLFIALFGKLRKLLNRDKVSRIFKIIWFIYYLYFIFFGIVLESKRISSKKSFSIEERGILSIAVTIFVSVFILLSIAALHTIYVSETVVWFFNKKYGKLYLMHAFDKNTILCRAEKKNDITEYVLIPKSEFLGEKIYYERVFSCEGDDNEKIV